MANRLNLFKKIKMFLVSLFKSSQFVTLNSNSLIIEGDFQKDETAIITNSEIIVRAKGSLIIKNNVSISDFIIRVDQGIVIIESDCILIKGRMSQCKPMIHCVNGELFINHHSVIKANILVKFGGKCSIGIYNAINENTEIRCDESLTIGDFNMISYECSIYDTNTHNIYDIEKRRALTKKDFPYIGEENEKPVTKPVIIGNDCWIGKRATVLKGVKIGDNAIVATSAVVTKEIPPKFIAYGNPAILKMISLF